MMDPLILSFASLGLLCLTWVHVTRFSRIKATLKTYAKRHNLGTLPLTRPNPSVPPTRKEYPMTPYEAQGILQGVAMLEMPLVTSYSVQFALFKTYGIPTISKLLNSTTEFRDPAKAGKRFVDTLILINSFVHYPIAGPGSGAPTGPTPPDPRGAIGVARINWLHSRYPGKISNDDLLYTLSTFMLEPTIWASRYDWRSLTPLEEIAFLVYFSEFGRRMGVTDIPTEITELDAWAEAYESEHMVPAECCRDVAAATIRLLIHNVPYWARGIANKVVPCLMYDRLRTSIMVPHPSPILESIVYRTLRLRAVIVRHFCLPRADKNKVTVFPDERTNPAFPEGFIPSSTTGKASSEKPASATPDTEGQVYAPRMFPTFYENEPWYSEPNTGLRGVVDSLFLTLGIWREDQVPGPKFKPEGFRLEQCGPIYLEGRGEEAVRKMAEEMLGAPLEGPYTTGGCVMRCPFAAA